MSALGPRCISVNADGTPDGFEPPLTHFGEVDPRGGTRLVVSAPPDRLAQVHQVLVGRLLPPLAVLYRQKVDRRNPDLNPATQQPRDFVGLELSAERVLQALQTCAPIVYHDARAEIWIRGSLKEQVVLDEDGVIYVYPDDPTFRDALLAAGVPEGAATTLAERDYPLRYYRSEADASEEALRRSLALAEVPYRR